MGERIEGHPALAEKIKQTKGATLIRAKRHGKTRKMHFTHYLKKHFSRNSEEKGLLKQGLDKKISKASSSRGMPFSCEKKKRRGNSISANSQNSGNKKNRRVGKGGGHNGENEGGVSILRGDPVTGGSFFVLRSGGSERSITPRSIRRLVGRNVNFSGDRAGGGSKCGFLI